MYEGHDVPKTFNGPNPKDVDQSDRHPGGQLTQNGLFADAAARYKRGVSPTELVKVYEKIRSGIWVYNGLFELVDSWVEQSEGRKVFKFKLRLSGEEITERPVPTATALEDDRVIPSWVKLEVWKRDQGRCISCSATSNLHFDHIIPYSKGGSSKDPKNVQILCGRHNLAKRDRIE
ncbi:MAG: HNH endonuclease [Terriglobales bacterium]